VLPAGEYIRMVTLLVGAAAGVIALVVHLDRPALALPVLVGTAVALPMEFRSPIGGAGMASSLPFAAAICGLWLVRSVVARDWSGFDRSRVVVAAIAFMSVTLLAFAMGQFPWFPQSGAPLGAQVVELALFLLSGCLFLAAGQQIERLSQLRWLTWVFVGTGAVACIARMTPALESLGRLTRPGSVGSLFWTWFVAVTVSQALVNNHLRLRVRIGLLGLASMALYHGLFQVRSWASGWLPALVAVGIIITVWRPRLTICLATLAVPVGLYVTSDIVTAMLVEESYSLSTRQEAWIVLTQIVERSPLLGTGLANYYYYAANFPILGWYVPFISHNNYQDLLVQTGFLGLLSFCWFGLEGVLLTFRLSRQAPPGFPRAFAIGALGGAVGSLAAGMLGDWIIPFYYNAGLLGFRSSLLFWVFLGGALALRRMVARATPVRHSVRAHAHLARGGRPAGAVSLA
jgi:hypothetical protein